ncbi:MAG TPA: hypothetical protein VMB50_23980 [Myxococcales bacterium]|nr:hypothetical protein [Myxococcales bacterium]
MKSLFWIAGLVSAFAVTATCGGKSPYSCANGSAGVGVPYGDPAIGSLSVDVGSTPEDDLPICPKAQRCQCSAGSFAVVAALDTGLSVTVSVYEPAAGTFPADNGAGESNSITYAPGTGEVDCSDTDGASGSITLNSYSASDGATVSGSFSGTLGSCGPTGAGGATLTNGTFSCTCNE